MAKLTLYFNDTPIDVFHLEQVVSSIGRGLSNTFTIDSLAIAPTHLKISHLHDEYFIESLSEQFPTLVNDKRVQNATLHQNDKITLGKHTLLYSQPPKISSKPIKDTVTNPSNNLGTASLQATNGPNIGLVISLNKALTEINIAGITPAIIAKRPDGFYLSRLTDALGIYINDQLLSDEAKLDTEASIKIGDAKYLFFIE